MLLPTDLLNPAPDADWDLHPGSVPIPAAEIEARVQELPKPGKGLRVIAGPGAEEALETLSRLGREATLHQESPGPRTGLRYRLWSTQPLLDLAGESPGSALDLGCGVGRDAIALAAMGWRVVARDRLSDALDRARKMELRYLIRPTITWEAGDLHEPGPAEFDLVLCVMAGGMRSLRSALGRVRPGGRVLFETFTAAYQEAHHHPGSPLAAVDPERDFRGMDIAHLQVTDRTVSAILLA